MDRQRYPATLYSTPHLNLDFRLFVAHDAFVHFTSGHLLDHGQTEDRVFFPASCVDKSSRDGCRFCSQPFLACNLMKNYLCLQVNSTWTIFIVFEIKKPNARNSPSLKEWLIFRNNTRALFTMCRARYQPNWKHLIWRTWMFFEHLSPYQNIVLSSDGLSKI